MVGKMRFCGGDADVDDEYNECDVMMMMLTLLRLWLWLWLLRWNMEVGMRGTGLFKVILSEF